MPAADPPASADLSGTRLGNYRLVRMLGRGRMGAVYLADDTALLRPTAVKVLSWLLPTEPGLDPVQWFLSEARLIARINHPRVVQIYGAAQAGAHFYIAMEYVPGQSAEALLQQGPLSPRRATDLVLQVASALQAAHRVGVVHRDVKPANILLDHQEVAKLGDFGMALTASAARANPNLKAGTPYYTAPEVWHGQPAGPSVDLYSLGATWFHLLTGKPPFPGRDSDTVRRGHLGAQVPDPRELVPTIPAPCAALVRELLAKTPQERPASAQVLVWEVRKLQQELESAARGIQAPLPPLQQARAQASESRQRPPGEEPPRREAGQTARLALVEALGLSKRPLVELEPDESIYTGEPLKAARAALDAWAANPDAPLFALTGAAGSGRSTLARQLAFRLSQARLVLQSDLSAGASRGSPLQQLCSAAGSPSGTGDQTRAEDRLDALLDRLALETAQGRPAPIVILDSVALPLRPESEPGQLIGAASWVRSFKLLLVGPKGLAAGLGASGLELRPEPISEIATSPLSAAGVGAYLRVWLSARLGPHAPPLLVSPDAVLLLASRSGGVLSRVNLLAENMLLLAAAEGSRVLSSWHAWAASDTERWAQRRLIGSLPRRGRDWPTKAFLEAVDACRNAAGRPPFPRLSAASGRRATPTDGLDGKRS
jgi:serine/threonine protein kinase/type II secretory pathway predicted ATPase ExeA